MSPPLLLISWDRSFFMARIRFQDWLIHSSSMVDFSYSVWGKMLSKKCLAKLYHIFSTVFKSGHSKISVFFKDPTFCPTICFDRRVFLLVKPCIFWEVRWRLKKEWYVNVIICVLKFIFSEKIETATMSLKETIPVS